jgi:hypothetical protein
MGTTMNQQRRLGYFLLVGWSTAMLAMWPVAAHAMHTAVSAYDYMRLLDYRSIGLLMTWAALGGAFPAILALVSDRVLVTNTALLFFKDVAQGALAGFVTLLLILVGESLQYQIPPMLRIAALFFAGCLRKRFFAFLTDGASRMWGAGLDRADAWLRAGAPRTPPAPPKE